MNNIKVVPAILEQDFIKIESMFNNVSGIVNVVQVDVCDGKFVPSKTFGSAGHEDSFIQLHKLANGTELCIELDMMVDLDADINSMFDKWMSVVKCSGATRVVFHVGSTVKWGTLFDSLKEVDIVVGLGIHIDSDRGLVSNLLKDYDFKFAQVMGIEKVGYGGQSFSDLALDVIQWLQIEFPNLELSVDGGVNLNTAPKLVSAGVTQLTAGSAIFRSDNIEEAIRLLANS